MYVNAFDLFKNIVEIKQKQTYFLAPYKRFFCLHSPMPYELHQKFLPSERSCGVI